LASNVAVTNFPGTQTIVGTVAIAGGTISGGGGTVTVSNFPTIQAVSGTVGVVLPASSTSIGNVGVIGGVTIANLPGTQAVSGTVTVANQGSSSSTVTVSNAVTLAAGSAAIGSVSVSNLPATQAVSGTVSVTNLAGSASIGNVGILGTPAVSISGTPTVTVSGTPNVAVTSLPALPAGSNTIGAVTIPGTVAVSGSFSPAGTQVVTGTISSLSTIQNAVTLATGANSIGSIGTGTLAIGSVGAITAQSNQNLFTTSGTYATGLCIGSTSSGGGSGVIPFTGLIRNGKTSGLVQNAMIFTSDAQATASFDLFIFGANPSSSTVTDHTAFALAAADFGKVAGVMHVSDASAAGTPYAFQAQQQAIPVVASSGTIYGAIVQRGTFSTTSTQDIGINLTFLSD